MAVNILCAAFYSSLLKIVTRTFDWAGKRCTNHHLVIFITSVPGVVVKSAFNIVISIALCFAEQVIGMVISIV